MRHEISHPLEQAEARAALDRALGAYRDHLAEYDFETSWLDQETATLSARVGGRKLEGTIKVCPDCYEIQVQLPFLFRVFEGRIRSGLDDQFARFLEASSGHVAGGAE